MTNAAPLSFSAAKRTTAADHSAGLSCIFSSARSLMRLEAETNRPILDLFVTHVACLAYKLIGLALRRSQGQLFACTWELGWNHGLPHGLET